MAFQSADATRWVSKGKAGEELGISPQRVGQLARRWPETEDERGRIDIERLKELREKNADPLRQAVYHQQRELLAGAAASKKSTQPAPESESPIDELDFNAARTRRERANARLAELKAAQESGRLIERDEVLRKEFKIARMIRDRLLALPARLAQVVPGEALRVVEDVCNDTIQQMQSDVAHFTSTHPVVNGSGSRNDR